MKKRKFTRFIPLFALSILTSSCTLVGGENAQSPVNTPILNSYECVFHSTEKINENEDNTTDIISKVTVKEHENVSFSGLTPTKESDAFNSYNFYGWSSSLNDITKNTHFYPVFSAIEREYKVTFLNWDGTLLWETTVKAGESCDYGLSTPPSKESDDMYSYEFDGWIGADLTNITSDITVTANFRAVTRKYQVTFQNYDGTTLYKTEVTAGQPIGTYNGAVTPYRKPTVINDDTQYTYSFSGWAIDGVVTNIYNYIVTKDTIVVAQFTSSVQRSDRLDFIDLINKNSQNTVIYDGNTYKVIDLIPSDPFYALGYCENNKLFLLHYTGNIDITSADNTTSRTFTVTINVPFTFRNLTSATGNAQFSSSIGNAILSFGCDVPHDNLTGVNNIQTTFSSESVRGYISDMMDKLNTSIIVNYNRRLKNYLEQDLGYDTSFSIYN